MIITKAATPEYRDGWDRVFAPARHCSRCKAIEGAVRDGRIVDLREHDTDRGHELLCFWCFCP